MAPSSVHQSARHRFGVLLAILIGVGAAFSSARSVCAQVVPDTFYFEVDGDYGDWLAAAALIDGCGGGGGGGGGGSDATGPDSEPGSLVQTALSLVETREAQHHSFAALASDARAIREEAPAYACEIIPPPPATELTVLHPPGLPLGPLPP